MDRDFTLAGRRSAEATSGSTSVHALRDRSRPLTISHFLLPALSPDMVIVVDNVGAHRPERIRELVAAAGCELVFLPAYSPDLSPSEEAFSKIKALVKAAAARTRAALDAAIAAALETVIPADAAGWFSHAGYPTRQAA